VEPLAPADLPLPSPAEYPFTGALRLSLGGARPAHELHIGVQAPPDAASDRQILVGRPIQRNQNLSWTLVDRAHLANGKYVTESPPFPGVMDEGVFVFVGPPENGCISFKAVVLDFGAPWWLAALDDPFGFYTDVQSVVFAKRCDSPLTIQVRDPDTDAIIQQINAVSPAGNGDIDTLPEILTDDHSGPIVAQVNTFNGQQVDHIEIRFSEPVDPATVHDHFIVEDSHGAAVAGSVDLSLGNTLAAFHPTVPFHLGEHYLVRLDGITDLAGNALTAGVIAFTPFDPLSTDPYPLAKLSDVAGLGSALTKCANGACNSSVRDTASIGNVLFLANGLANASERYQVFPPERVIAVDSTKVTAPITIGFTGTPSNPRALEAIPHASFTRPDGFRFSGDLLAIASGGRILDNVDLPSRVDVYDVTKCTAPATVPNCLDDATQPRRAVAFLSTPPDTGAPPGVPPGSGVPQQMAVLHQAASAPGADDALAAYVVVSGVGLEALNVSKLFGVPDGSAPFVGPDGLVQGDFLDVAVVKSQVAAIEQHAATGEFTLDLFSAQLTNRLPIGLPGPAARVAVLENLVVDIDGDGNLGTAEDDDNDDTTAREELFDLALVSSGPLSNCPPASPSPCGEIAVVDLSALTDLHHQVDRAVIERIPLPGPVFSIQIDPDAHLAYAEVRGRGLAVIDLSHLTRAIAAGASSTSIQDANNDGIDDRVLAVVPKPDIFGGEIRIDLARGVALINGSTSGITTVKISDQCNELTADFVASEPDPGVQGDRTGRDNPGRKLLAEKNTLLPILDQAVVELGNAAITHVALLEQGSGSCFWRAPLADQFPPGTPPEDILAALCSSFQAGTSDHDIEVFVPQEQVQQAQAILDDYLDEQNADPDSPLKSIGRLTLFAVSRDSFEAGELLNGTPRNRTGDPAGDLAMGRQSLLLLWILEGEYVTGHEGKPLNEILDELKAVPSGEHNTVIPGEPSAIPRLEGYEWSLLQQLNFYKTGAMLRKAGACTVGVDMAADPAALNDAEVNDRAVNTEGSDFLNQECQEQLHTAAKAAIRAVLARLAADALANPELLQITRDSYRRDACLSGVTDVRNPPPFVDGYTPKSCGSFEEFILSTAVKSVRDGLGVFQPTDLPTIFTFYCAKVGEHCANRDGQLIGGPLFSTDDEANTFLAGAINFIEAVRARTFQVYSDTVPLDAKPIGDLPFLSDISTICQPLIGHGIGTTSPRSDLRLCNGQIVLRKLNGDPTVQADSPQSGGPPAPIELADKERRDFLEKRYGVLNVVITDLRVRASNLGSRTVSDLTMRMYAGDGLDQAQYHALKDVPLTLAPAERRVIEADEQREPVFPTSFGLSSMTPGVAGAVAFFFDPERRVPEGDKKDNQAAFFYYLLDKTNPAAPVLPPAPVTAIPDDDSDPICGAQRAFTLQLTAHPVEINPAAGSDTLTVQIGQQVQLDYRVINRGNVPMTDLTVYRTGSADPVFGPTALPAASSAPTGIRQLETFTPGGTGTFYIVATAAAKDDKGNTIAADPARVRINVIPPPCAAIITTLQPDPNAYDDAGMPLSTVMRGGTAYRYYKVINATTGQPVANGNVTVLITELPGGTPRSIVVHTDANGLVVHDPVDSSDDPKGLVLSSENLGADIADYEVKLNAVDGFPTVCAQTAVARLQSFTFTESLKTGLSMNLGAEAEFGLGVEGGGSLDLSLDGHIEGEGATGERIFDRLSVSRAEQLKASVSFEPKLGEFKAKFIGQVAITGPKLELALSQTISAGDKYQFPPGLPLSDASKAQLVALALDPIQGGPILGMFRRHLTGIAGPADSLLSSESGAVTFTGSADLHLFSVLFGITEAQYKSGKSVFSAGVGTGGSLTFSDTIENQTQAGQIALTARANGKMDAEAALNSGFEKEKEKDESKPKDPAKPGLDKVGLQMTGILDLLKTGGEGGISEGVGVRWLLDKNNDFLPKQLDFFIDTEKKYGFEVFGQEIKLISGGTGGQITRTYSVIGLDRILQVLQDITNPVGLLGSVFSAKYNTDPTFFYGPTRLHEDLIAFLDAVIADAKVSEDVRDGDGNAFSIGGGGDLFGVGVKAGVSLKMDHAIGHARRRSVLKNGDEYRLEDYSKTELPALDEAGLIATVKDVGPTVLGAIQSALHPVSRQANPSGGGNIRSSNSASLTTTSDADYQAIDALYSYDFEPVAGPVQPVRYAPDAVTGTAGKPHYGVGGFHDFSPRDFTLSVPATLAIDYHDDEVSGFDPATLRVYRWNDDRRDWDLVGGIVDLPTRTVTAQVDRLGTYTLAPTMPAGALTWTVEAITIVNAGTPDAHTRVTLRSSAATTNDGAPIAGALFHVFSLSPMSVDSSGALLVGDPVTADLDAATPGVQLVTDANGILHVEYDYAGVLPGVRMFSFSDVGTASSDQLVEFAQP